LRNIILLKIKSTQKVVNFEFQSRLYLMVEMFYFKVMLTCALRAQVKELKIEIKNKFYIKSITFATFKALNAQVSRKIFYICLFNLCPKCI